MRNVIFVSLYFVFACNDSEIILVTVSKIQGITAVAGEGQVTISWDSTENAISYNIYWSDSAGLNTENGTLIPNIVSPYTHTDRDFGTTYYYIVTALNEGGESPASEEVSATIRPARPTNVNGLIEGDTITISWNNVFWSDIIQPI